LTGIFHWRKTPVLSIA